jgi:ABC-2 type transport system permease protein
MDLAQELRTAYTIWNRDMLRFVRDRARVLSSIGQPLLFLLLFGAGFSPSMTNLGGGGIGFSQFFFAGILAMTVLFTAVYSAVSIVWDRQFGFLKEVQVTPASGVAVALGKVAGGTTVATLQGAVMLLLAPILGLRLGLGQVASLFGLLILLSAMLTSLGLLLAARQRSMEGFHMVMNFILLPLFFLSGAFFPLQGVPLWMRLLAGIDPVTYGVDPLRSALLSGSVSTAALQAVTLHPVLLNVLVMLGFSLAFLIPGIWLFARQD